METKERTIKSNLKLVKKSKPVWEKRTAGFSRWLHIYLSMVSFIVILFFAVTGITLNHAEWFDGKQIENKITGKVPVLWVNNTDTNKINKLGITELFRKQYNIKGFVSDFLIQSDQCSVTFKGPGYSADAFINRKDGTFKLSELKLGVVAVLNDLHKGRDSGKSWSWVIDIAAGFLALVSLTGLVMLLFMKKKRSAGLVLVLLGGLVCYLVYYIWIA